MIIDPRSSCAELSKLVRDPPRMGPVFRRPHRIFRRCGPRHGRPPRLPRRHGSLQRKLPRIHREPASLFQTPPPILRASARTSSVSPSPPEDAPPTSESPSSLPNPARRSPNLRSEPPTSSPILRQYPHPSLRDITYASPIASKPTHLYPTLHIQGSLSRYPRRYRRSCAGRPFASAFFDRGGHAAGVKEQSSCRRRR